MINKSYFTGIQQYIKEEIQYYPRVCKSTSAIKKILDDFQALIIKNKDQINIKQAVPKVIKIASCAIRVFLLIKLAEKAIFRSPLNFRADRAFNSDRPLSSRSQSAADLNQIPSPPQERDNSFVKDPISAINCLQDPAIKPVESAEAFPVAFQANDEDSVHYLMDYFTDAWKADKKSFDFSKKPFELEKFSAHLSEHAKRFKKAGIDYAQHFGYIEKFDLDPSDNPRIYMRADLHGDLKSLIENIRTLQKQNLLDQNFKCQPGVHLVFLGDYCDRGKYGTQILELLMRLREENPNQVHLIRGNHEYRDANRKFGATDPNLMDTLKNKKAKKALKRFYETMSLTTYFSVNQDENREYVQCTHGLFEVTQDTSPLLDQGNSSAYLAVPKKRELSDRIHRIANSDSELSKAAQRIDYLAKQYIEGENITAYNWADVAIDETRTGELGQRYYALSVEDIDYYLQLSSEKHRVAMVFRGHQHGFQHHMYKDQVLVTTLPVGMDCPGYQNRFIQKDRAYIIFPKPQVKKWLKYAILREKGENETDEITRTHLLTSSEI